MLSLRSGRGCGRPDRPRRSKSLFSFNVLNKNNTFPLPAAPGRLPPPAPALKIVIFHLTFFIKTILFLWEGSRPAAPTGPGAKKEEEKEEEEKEEATAAAFDGGGSKHTRNNKKLYIQTPDRPPQRLLLVV